MLPVAIWLKITKPEVGYALIMVVNGSSEADQNIILNQCKMSCRF